MADFGLVWRSEEVVHQTVAGLVQHGRQLGQLLRDDTVRLLNRSQPTRTTASGRRVGLDPSKPGEPPKRLTSRLIKSITYEVAVEGSGLISSSVVIRFGTNVIYGRRLERGFVGTDSLGRNVSQLPRPYLGRALANRKEGVARILATGAAA